MPEGLNGIRKLTAGVPIGGWGRIEGLVEAGNTDLYNRPNIPNNWTNPNGTDILPKPSLGGRSSVRSMSFQPDENGPEVLIPTAADGKLLTPDQAIDRYRRTGEHMGKFTSPDAATAYAARYHNDAAAGRYNSPGGLSLVLPKPGQSR